MLRKYLFFSALYIFGILALSLLHLNQEKRERISSHIRRSAELLDQKIQNALYGYMEENLNRFLRPSNFLLFFEDDSERSSESLSGLRLSLIDSLRFNPDLKDVTLYRNSDNSVVSALNPGFDITGISNPFEYVRTVLNMERPNEPGFLLLPSGEFYYYYPVYTLSGSALPQAGFALAQLRDPEEFFNTGAASLNPFATFTVLNGGRPLAAEGSQILSEETLDSLIGNSRPDTFFSYSGRGLTPYNLFYTPSGLSGDLIYAYYEPRPFFLSSLAAAPDNSLFYPVLVSSLCILILAALLFYAASGHWKGRQERPHRIPELKEDDTAMPAILPAASQPFCCALLIHCRKRDASGGLQAIREEVRMAASNYLAACQLSHSITEQRETVICYVSYQDYSLELLAGSLLQVLCTSEPAGRFNLYYTRSFRSREELAAGVEYLLERLVYSDYLGFSRTLSQEYLELCGRSVDPVDPDASRLTARLLAERRIPALIAYLDEKKDLLNGRPYSLNSIRLFVESVFYAVRSYFSDNFPAHPVTRLTLPELLQRTPGSTEILDYLSSCLEDCAELLGSPAAVGQRFTEAVCSYIDGSLSTVTLNSLAEHFHVSAGHLSRQFRECTGIGFSDYLLEKKLQAAKQLIEQNPSLTNIEIARTLGYTTPVYFSGRFKERFGLTPGAYRKYCLSESELFP